MAREVTEKISCDKSGCRKQPGTGDNEHVIVTATVDSQYGLAAEISATPQYDFCSWDHAAEHMRELGKVQKEHIREVERARADAAREIAPPAASTPDGG